MNVLNQNENAFSLTAFYFFCFFFFLLSSFFFILSLQGCYQYPRQFIVNLVDFQQFC